MTEKNNIPTATYNWPLDQATSGKTPGEQIEHILTSQVTAIETAIRDDKKTTPEIEDLIAEMHHGLESFWRALALRNDQDYVDAIFQRHEDKTAERV